MTLNAAKSGSFKIAGDLEMHRLGYGAMRITGEGVWGEPKDRAECLRTLKRLPELGINFIDTANSYGPDVSEQLIRAIMVGDDPEILVSELQNQFPDEAIEVNENCDPGLIAKVVRLIERPGQVCELPVEIRNRGF